MQQTLLQKIQPVLSAGFFVAATTQPRCRLQTASADNDSATTPLTPIWPPPWLPSSSADSHRLLSANDVARSFFTNLHGKSDGRARVPAGKPFSAVWHGLCMDVLVSRVAAQDLMRDFFYELGSA
jgi:hypothetical protein